jgi:hypothetical protein
MANTSYLGTDLALGFTAIEGGITIAGPFSRVDLQALPVGNARTRSFDLAVQTGVGNLVQSLVLRVMTEVGELAPLGHPNYGSRHHQLIGEPNTESNRNLLKLHIIACIKQEPRIDSIAKIEVNQGNGLQHRDEVDVKMTLIIKSIPDPLSLVIPFSFAGPLS